MKRLAATTSIYRLIRSQVMTITKWLVMALISPMALAAPSGGQVSAGTGAIAQAGTTTTITQQSQNLAIDWNTFSIAANESVIFNQPNASAIALNRILGTDPSQIFGSLSANGQVFILNPNGVLFGQGAQVNVGGLVASTLSLSNADFNAGKYHFRNRGAAGSVVNQGKLTAANGGYIALLAPEVRNEGVITATLGTALLAAGNKVTLNLDNGSLLGYSIDQGALNALAENKQLIQADGGQVIMSARAADALSTAVVNNTGIIEARTVQNIGGVIKLMGDMQTGQVNVGGTLDASAPNGGNGGFVETSAARVQVADTAHVTTAAANGHSGTWLIDPIDFTIAAGSGALTTSGIGADTLSTNLGSTSVVIVTDASTGGNGDIFVNSTVSWSANMLTLSAHRNININADLNGSGTAQLTLAYGQGAVAAGNTSSYVIAPGVQVNLPAGGNFSTRLGSDGSVINYTVITDLGAEGSTSSTDLQGMNGNLAGNYVLGADIDASLTSGWNAGAGFAPVGDNTSQFTGIFDGLGHTIGDLVINRPATNYAGLFGYTAAGSIIRNVGSVGGSVSGNAVTGGLVGYSSGSINNAYATGSVNGSSSSTGGLAGFNSVGGSISASYATGNVNGSDYTGGLVGTSYGTIDTSYASGNVSGNDYVGGLVGINLDAISNAYASGSVSGSTYVGGLVGYNNGSFIYRATINTSYASGSVSGSFNAGGLVGTNYNYRDSNNPDIIPYDSISNSYWDTQTSGTVTGIGGGDSFTGATGLSTSGMMTMASFAGWDIANTPGAGTVWRIYEGYTNPLLSSFLKPLTVTANNDSKTYSGLAYSGGNGVSYSVASPVLYGTPVYGGTSQGAKDAGSYTITPSGLYPDQQGYDISYVDGTLTINPAALTAIANNNGKAIGDLEPDLYSTGVSFSGFVNGENPSVLAGTLALDRVAGEAAGNYDINASGLTSGNYNITYVPGVFTISPPGQLLIVMANGSAVYGVDPAGLLFTPIYASYSVGGVITDLLAGVTPPGNNSWTLNDGVTSFTAGTGYVLGGNVGNYTIDTGATATSTNPNFLNNIATTPGTLSITQLPVTLTAPVAPTKVYDGTNLLAVTGSTIGISNKVGSDVVSITGSGTYADKDVAFGKNYTLDNLALAGAAAGNYSLAVASLNGTDGVITPAALTVTANADSKMYNGLAYSGGNGVAYTGLVNGETSAVIGGTLLYGGTSQGAVNPGTYLITPSGLTSGNYNISYVNGTLTVDPSTQAAFALGGNDLVLAYNAAQQGVADTDTHTDGMTGQTGANGKLITLVNCGVLMPPDAPANTCQ